MILLPSSSSCLNPFFLVCASYSPTHTSPHPWSVPSPVSPSLSSLSSSSYSLTLVPLSFRRPLRHSILASNASSFPIFLPFSFLRPSVLPFLPSNDPPSSCPSHPHSFLPHLPFVSFSHPLLVHPPVPSLLHPPLSSSLPPFMRPSVRPFLSPSLPPSSRPHLQDTHDLSPGSKNAAAHNISSSSDFPCSSWLAHNSPRV